LQVAVAAQVVVVVQCSRWWRWRSAGAAGSMQVGRTRYIYIYIYIYIEEFATYNDKCEEVLHNMKITKATCFSSSRMVRW
jgi:hypothetical protein